MFTDVRGLVTYTIRRSFSVLSALRCIEMGPSTRWVPGDRGWILPICSHAAQRALGHARGFLGGRRALGGREFDRPL